MVKLDLSAVLAQAIAIGKANTALILPLAGMFLLLPGIVADQFLTAPIMLDPAATSQQLMERFSLFAQQNWAPLLVRGVVTSFGSLAILALVLRVDRPTVAEAMQHAVHVLPIFILANLIQSMIVVSGFMLFIVPGFYFIGRLLLVSAVAANEGARNPLSPLTRSAALTHGNGWRAFLLVAVIFIVGMIAAVVTTSIAGIVLSLALPAEVAGLGQMLIGGLVETALAVAIILASAALYLALSEKSAARWPG